MLLSKLYSRRSDGKVQVWVVEIEGSRYRTVSWINPDGGSTTSEWTQCLGKQKRTPEQQAEKEAAAHHKKKLEQGGYHTDITNIDTPKYFEPMLAKSYDDHAKLVAMELAAGRRVFLQPKLDGMRCIAQPSGMTSRNGKPIVCAPHIFGAIKSRFPSTMNWVVDGELYADKFASDFEKIMSLAKKTQPELSDLMESAQLLEYHVYDIPILGGEDTDLALCNRFSVRLNSMRFLLSAASLPLRLVETVEIKTIAEIAEHFARWREAGYEGAMIRLDAAYEQKRSKHLLKFKEFQDAEFTVISVDEGIGNRSGMAGNLTLRLPDGRTFKSGMRGKVAFLKRILAERDLACSLVGRRVTITFQNYTSDGIPRFPIFLRVREDE